MKPVIKPQYVDSIPKNPKVKTRKVGEYIKERDILKKSDDLKEALELDKLYDRQVDELSGG